MHIGDANGLLSGALTSGGRFPIENPEKSGKNGFGLVTCRIQFGKNPKPCFHDFRFLDVPVATNTDYFKLWVHQMTPTILRTIHIISTNNIFIEFKILELHDFEVV